MIAEPTIAQRNDLDKIEAVEDFILQNVPQEDCPLQHHFAPGIYMREILMRKGLVVIGHEHNTEHLNVVHTGSATVIMDGVMHHIVAPAIFKSMPHVRKILYIHEDMLWSTIHPTEETNIDKLTETLVTKSLSYLKYAEDMKVLQDAALAAAIKGDN